MAINSCYVQQNVTNKMSTLFKISSLFKTEHFCGPSTQSNYLTECTYCIADYKMLSLSSPKQINSIASFDTMSHSGLFEYL